MPQAIWKRRISLRKRTDKIEKTVDELCTYLDTFYNDIEGWLELADIYSSCNQYVTFSLSLHQVLLPTRYTQSLQALSHALLLAPQSPFHFLRFAETAYTAGDIPLAIKMCLVVVDMTERDVSSPHETAATGISIRAWWGVKLVSFLSQLVSLDSLLVSVPVDYWQTLLSLQLQGRRLRRT